MRNAAGLPLDEAICVYDLAERLGIEVRFVDIPSMEGMYCRELGPAIIVSALRPAGRRAYNCAHELGHHSNGDGTQLDQIIENSPGNRLDPKEFAADCFAGALLMPKMAVQRAFVLREWSIRECSPGQVYAVANNFGVGYSTLVYHMRSSLRLLAHDHATMLLKVSFRRARAEAVGWESPSEAWIVDSNWKGRSIDVEVGDLILVRGRPILEGVSISPVQDNRDGVVFRALKPGISRFSEGSDWAAFVRVSRRGFVGRSIFRHMEEVEDEGPLGY